MISGLLEVEEYNALRDYIKPICHELERTGKSNSHGFCGDQCPVCGKDRRGGAQWRPFNSGGSSAWQRFPLPDWDLVRILANLIDNAITASLRSDETEKTPKPTVTVQVSENACRSICLRYAIMALGFGGKSGAHILQPDFL